MGTAMFIIIGILMCLSVLEILQSSKERKDV
jgi:hypothetical protein